MMHLLLLPVIAYAATIPVLKMEDVGIDPAFIMGLHANPAAIPTLCTNPASIPQLFRDSLGPFAGPLAADPTVLAVFCQRQDLIKRGVEAAYVIETTGEQSDEGLLGDIIAYRDLVSAGCKNTALLDTVHGILKVIPRSLFSLGCTSPALISTLIAPFLPKSSPNAFSHNADAREAHIPHVPAAEANKFLGIKNPFATESTGEVSAPGGEGGGWLESGLSMFTSGADTFKQAQETYDQTQKMMNAFTLITKLKDDVMRLYEEGLQVKAGAQQRLDALRGASNHKFQLLTAAGNGEFNALVEGGTNQVINMIMKAMALKEDTEVLFETLMPLLSSNTRRRLELLENEN